VWFTPALGILLGGYLFFNKTFAYLHLPGTPVFVGEIVLAIGAVEAWRARVRWRRLLATSPALKVTLVLLLVAGVRLAVDLPAYGLDAIRDSSIAYYAAFAFLAAAAAVHEPTFTPRLLGWYQRVLPAFLLWAPVAVLLSDVTALSDVVLPGTDTAVNSFKSGDYSVHIATAVGFLWLGGHRAANDGSEAGRSKVVVLSLVGLVGLLICGSQTRGGFLAGVTILVAVLAYLPPGRRRQLTFSLTAALVSVVAVILLLDLRLPGRDREVSLQGVVTNLSSLGGDDSTELGGTVEWRQVLWESVRDDALRSGAWTTGLGFGPVLGERYGVSGSDERQPLRNVHNSHLTIFARTGVVGVGLWALLLLVWCYGLHRSVRRHPARTRDPDTAVNAWLLASMLGFLVNAYFDPSLEGPQACIWLYVMLGLGAARTRAHRLPSGWGPVRQRAR
jgi:hypothetical protein